MTKRFYYEDAYRREFTAQVISCRPADGGYEVILDQTAFYPEGGGQPCDLGTLEAAEQDSDAGQSEYADAAERTGLTGNPAGAAGSTVSVLDVQESGEEVLHLCSAPLEAGTLVRGQIDWQRRLTHMREHSGEHIISGIICKTHHYSNIGFHMGKDCVTIDFSGYLTEEEIAAAERAANEKVLENVEILAEYPDAGTLQKLDYRSKKELDGAIRIVTVPGADVCACCGTHVRYTGEIGPIKVIGSEHYKNGIRLTLLIGEKALADYTQKSENVRKISTLLSVKPEHTAEAVEKLQESMSQLKLAYGALKLIASTVTSAHLTTAVRIVVEPVGVGTR